MNTPDSILARQRAEDKRRGAVREGRREPFAAPYGNSSSYTPASDTCSAPFVPAAESYSPPPTDPVPSFDGAGGTFDGGGAGGDC